MHTTPFYFLSFYTHTHYSFISFYTHTHTTLSFYFLSFYTHTHTHTHISPLCYLSYALLLPNHFPQELERVKAVLEARESRMVDMSRELIQSNETNQELQRCAAGLLLDGGGRGIFSPLDSCEVNTSYISLPPLNLGNFRFAPQ